MPELTLADRTAGPAPSRSRIEAVDFARGLALLAMASFHFTWDLEFFGYLAPGTTGHGLLKLYARGIASSFLFLVGTSLVLANAGGIRWRPFWKRLGMVAGAAALITLGTFFAMREEFIFFGILHQIALASLLGLLFLRVPPAATLVLATLVIAAPFQLRSAAFDQPALWWVGLSQSPPRSNDYVPLFPWFGAVLIGIASAKLALNRGLIARLGRWTTPRLLRFVPLLGRHSLAFYLIHQPVLLGLLWLFALAMPPQPVTPEVRFLGGCQSSCTTQRSEDFCARYCACMLTLVEDQDLLTKILGNDLDAEAKTQLGEDAGLCTADTDADTPSDP